jgi:hypothetical protein
MQSTQLASCLVQGFGDQDVFSTPNGRNKSKRPLSADNSMDESLSDPKKFRFEDLSSITEDKELSQLDSLNKEAITKLGAALDFVKLLHERIIKLESELINAKLAFANAIINQFNSKQLLQTARLNTPCYVPLLTPSVCRYVCALRACVVAV